MDSYLAVLDFVFIKKEFDHFLPMLLNKRARLLKVVIKEKLSVSTTSNVN
jgi:hypothetical protein